jgi:hypothetical protein
MDPGAVDGGTEVIVLVQLPLARSPVEPVRPVGEQILQVLAVGALRPVLTRRAVRPAGGSDPGTQIRQDLVVDLDRERLDAVRVWRAR